MILPAKVVQILKQCDLYGFPVTFNFENNDKHRSLIGGVSSIATVVLIVLFFWKAFIELIFMESYNISQTPISYFDPPKEIISMSDLMFSIKVDAESQIPLQIKKQLFNMTVTLKSNKNLRNGTIIKNKTLLSLSPCTLQSFEKIFTSSIDKQFSQFQLDNFFCLNQNQNFSLEGIYYSDTFQFIQIDVSECTSFSNCYTQEERNEIIEKFGVKYFRFFVSFSNFQLDILNENILLPKIDMDFQLVFMPGQFVSQADIFLEKNLFIDDKSVIPLIHDYYTRQFYLHQNIQPQTLFLNSTTTYSKVYLRLAQQQNEYLKQYQQVDKFLAYVGGILKIIFFIIGFLVSQYNKYGFYLKLANKLYIFNVPLIANYDRQNAQEDIEFYSLSYLQKKLKDRVLIIKKAIQQFQKGTKKIMLIQRSQNRKQSMGNQHLPSENSEQPILKNPENKEQEDDMNFHTRSQFLTYTFKEILNCRKEIKMMFRYLISRLFCRFFCYKKAEVQLVDKAIQMIRKDTDIAELINKLHEVDKMKKLLLTEDPKPVVSTQQLSTKKKQLKVLSKYEDLEKQIFQQNNPEIKKKKHQKTSRKSIFENNINFNSIDSLHKLYQAYDYLYHQNANNPHQKKFNHKLMLLIGDTLSEIFEVSYLLEDDDFGHQPNNRQISITARPNLQFPGYLDSEINGELTGGKPNELRQLNYHNQSMILKKPSS